MKHRRPGTGPCYQQGRARAGPKPDRSSGTVLPRLAVGMISANVGADAVFIRPFFDRGI